MGRFRGDLPERTFQFALMILELTDHLPENNKGWVVGKQLIRSGTAIGANVHEADNALTDAQFTSICSIARREAGETTYWLRLCRESGLLAEDMATSAITESQELASILSTIVRRLTDTSPSP